MGPWSFDQMFVKSTQSIVTIYLRLLVTSHHDCQDRSYSFSMRAS